MHPTSILFLTHHITLFTLDGVCARNLHATQQTMYSVMPIVGGSPDWATGRMDGSSILIIIIYIITLPVYHNLSYPLYSSAFVPVHFLLETTNKHCPYINLLFVLRLGCLIRLPSHECSSTLFLVYNRDHLLLSHSLSHTLCLSLSHLPSIFHDRPNAIVLLRAASGKASHKVPPFFGTLLQTACTRTYSLPSLHFVCCSNLSICFVLLMFPATHHLSIAFAFGCIYATKCIPNYQSTIALHSINK